jgi:hypothetical protein
MSGSVTFTPTELDVRSAYQLGTQRVSVKRLGYFLLFAAFVGLAVALLTGSTDLKEIATVVGAMLVWAVVATCLILIAVRFLWLPRYVRRVYAQQRDLREEIIVEWDNSHFSAHAASGHTKLKWTDFYRWQRSNDVILLYRSEALFNFLPTHDPKFRVAADEMEQLLVAAGVKEQ